MFNIFLKTGEVRHSEWPVIFDQVVPFKYFYILIQELSLSWKELLCAYAMACVSPACF